MEVDGLIHDASEVVEKDERRTAWLESQGLEILHIPASEIMRDSDEIALGILLRVKTIIGK